MSFSLSRYEQHIELPNVGIEGQEKIFSSKVLVVGAGGLGCPVLLYLMASGVGQLGIIDQDHVDKSNLQRQILYTNKDIGTLKVEAAKKRLEELSDNQSIKTYPFFLNNDNAENIIQEYDVIVDATDNHIARLLINEICLKLRKPWVYGSLFHFEGQVMTFNTSSDAPCFKCVFSDLDENSVLPTCKSAGILSSVPGAIGSMQATEVLKIILNLNGDNQNHKLYIINLLTYNMQSITVEKDRSCGCYNYEKTNL